MKIAFQKEVEAWTKRQCRLTYIEMQPHRIGNQHEPAWHFQNPAGGMDESIIRISSLSQFIVQGVTYLFVPEPNTMSLVTTVVVLSQ